ncbi:thiol:disulfide interchange protein DsbG [Paludibacterium yongneupense]|uniref:thiol:disulfide interchange protein DsbG n=1 Tax=Paludibacterium yongneupense TaxID=400061 RepID=UPI00042477F7|nr:thiol:disulfide interchange protein DsbG [Paludibacterium yongneupense]
MNSRLARRHVDVLVKRLTVLIAGVLLLAGGASARPALPAPLHAMEKQGFTIVGTFEAAGGLVAWAGFKGQSAVAFYLTPDGQHVIVGRMLDANGNDASESALKSVVVPAMHEGLWTDLGRSRWVADGKAAAPRVVYVFTDPDCPYCNRFWTAARPWVDSGKVQLRHVIVGILTPRSPGLAAALLAAQSPSAALAAHERTYLQGETHPLKRIPHDIEAQLDANAGLMETWGMQGTPAIIWRDARGGVRIRTGMPDAAGLNAIFGAR